VTGGETPLNYSKEKEFPMMPHRLEDDTFALPDSWRKNPLLGKLLDQSLPAYDDLVTGAARLHWQEPAKVWTMLEADDVLVLEEHDREEWNDTPYIGVAHLYEPPVGTEERPIRIETGGSPGDNSIVSCMGNCAPHIPQSTFYTSLKGYSKNKCVMCQQWYYIHNRPWLVMHPDWTDEPAADEGPAFTFAEMESEFDRDFHEFALYLNGE